jgi:hypothetical protein
VRRQARDGEGVLVVAAAARRNLVAHANLHAAEQLVVVHI